MITEGALFIVGQNLLEVPFLMPYGWAVQAGSGGTADSLPHFCTVRGGVRVYLMNWRRACDDSDCASVYASTSCTRTAYSTYLLRGEPWHRR
jgi:hypothetical protein